MTCKLQIINMSVDSVREVRTMILLSLPYPPLPITVSSVDPLELSAQGEQCQTTSHTLIARCLNDAAERADRGRNERRQKRQMTVFQEFLHALANGGFAMDAPALFALYCDFTKRHIDTYFEPGETTPHVAFGELHDAPKGGKPHAKMCEYMAGQSVLFQDSPPLPRHHFERKSYSSMLLMARDRLGHKMSEEEHAQAVALMQEKEGSEHPAVVECETD